MIRKLNLYFLIHLTIVVLVLTLFLSSCGKPEEKKPEPNTLSGKHKPVSTRVETMTLVPSTLSTYEQATATVASRRKANLSFKSAGNVVYIKNAKGNRTITEGDRVRKGELLARLDSETARINKKSKRIAVSQASLQISNKKTALNRAKRLHHAGAISDKELNQHQVAYQLALLDLDAAKVDYQKADSNQNNRALIAPFSGVITAMNLKEGQRVTPISPTMTAGAAANVPITIMDPSRFEAVAHVPVSIGSRIRKGQTAYLFYGTPQHRSNDLDKKHTIPARVVATSLSVNPSDRTLRIRIQPSRHDNQRLIDGSQVNVWFEVLRKKNALVLPLSAIKQEGTTTVVFVVDENQYAVKKQVQLGHMNKSGVDVVAGLVAGDNVVIKGASKLSDAEPVSVVLKQAHVASPKNKTHQATLETAL